MRSKFFAAIVLALGAGEFHFHRAQLGIAVERIIESRAMTLRRFLRDMRNHPFARHIQLARVLMQLPAQEREQARFAAAVRPDQADFVAGK